MNRRFKTGRLILSSALTLLVAFSAAGIAAAVPAQATVGLRIEGIEQNIYYGDVAVPDTGDLCVADILLAADSQSDGLTVIGADIGYISSINGDELANFGGWDGWLFKVNGLDPMVGILDYPVVDGDQILLYYGDPFGVGMQFPEADLSDLDAGIIRFTSLDTTYDAEYNPITSTNPVAGATVTWHTGTEATTYTTDANGEITIPALYRTAGMHPLSIQKTGDVPANGKLLPLVLRLAPDYAVEISASESSTDSVAESIDESSEISEPDMSADNSPQTGDSSNTSYLVLMALVAAALTAAYTFKRQTTKE